MIWALLFALIFSSSESPFINSGFKKQIKKHVENKEVEKELLQGIKDLEKYYKELGKKEKALNKELKKINADRNSTREDFNKIFLLYIEIYEDGQERGLESRVGLRERLDEETWEKIISDARITHEKNEKKRNKRIAKFQKTMSKKEKKALSTISSDKEREKAIEAIGEFKNEIIRIQEEMDHINYVDNEVLYSYSSTREDLESLQEHINELEKKAIKAFEDLHFKLLDYTNQAEWDQVQKSMNKLF